MKSCNRRTFGWKHRGNSAANLSQQAPLLPEGETLEHWEQMMIREALRRANNNKSQAARLLGLTRNALRYRLSQMGLESGSAENDDAATEGLSK